MAPNMTNPHTCTPSERRGGRPAKGPTRRRQGIALLALPLLLLLPLTATGVAASGGVPPPPTGISSPPPAPLPGLPSPRRALLAAINHERKLHHLHPLRLDRTESLCAKGHSIHMGRSGVLSHDQFPGDICIVHRFSGENVAMEGGTPQVTLLQLHAMFMQEGPCPRGGCRTLAERVAHTHYLNILDAHFRRIGIGIYVRDGVTWLTEDFAG